jgi:hypothetical protein
LRLARVCCVPPVWSERKSPLRSWISYIPLAAVGMLLDAADPSIVLARSAEPLLTPETDDERSGIVPNVVFPTASEQGPVRGSGPAFLRPCRARLRTRRVCAGPAGWTTPPSR